MPQKQNSSIEQDSGDRQKAQEPTETDLAYWTDLIEPKHLCTCRFAMAAHNGLLAQIPPRTLQKIPYGIWDLMVSFDSSKTALDYSFMWDEIERIPAHIIRAIPPERWQKIPHHSMVESHHLLYWAEKHEKLAYLLDISIWQKDFVGIQHFWGIIPDQAKTPEIRRHYKNTIFLMTQQNRKSKRLLSHQNR